MEIGAAANATNTPDRTAIVFDETRFTWRAWNARINQLAHALTGLGLQRGDKVAVMLRVADYKRPRSVDFVAEVARNPSGKLLKREIRAPYWEGRTRRV